MYQFQKNVTFVSMNTSMISQIVHQLLQTMECVTIPGFGAFVVNPVSARIDLAKNRLTPPGKQIGFNKNIQNNDGLLASNVARQQGISYEDAVFYIKGFVDVLESELKSKGSFDFGQVGMFFRTSEGIIRFEPTNHFGSFQFALEPFHLTPLAAQEVRQEPIPVKEQSEQIRIKYISKMSVWGKIGWAAAAIPFLAYIAWVPTQSRVLDKNVRFEFSDLNPLAPTPCAEYFVRPAGLTPIDFDASELLFEDFDEAHFHFAPAESTRVEIRIPEMDAIELPFQIIGGCFADESNANRLVNQLTQKGFSAQIFDRKNGLYRVTLGGYANSVEAREALRQIKDSEIPNAWLLRN
jgi:nucleoid DNA-binding protein